MISGQDLKEISRIVGSEHLMVTREDLAAYGADGTKMSFMPDAAAFPGSDEEISRLLGLATRKGFPVIPRGGGTGMSGGALPVKGGLVISMDRLNRILSIDPDNLVAKVQPGVITADLQESVEIHGLFYPPDPASLHTSTIGGNVAECAGGLRAVKYGVTRDYILGLTVVLPTGEIINTGVETVKGVAGYDLTRLIVGSEGTLAVTTAITVRLIPKPASQKTMAAFFPEVATAVQVVARIIRAKIVPAILEFMDRRCLECVREEITMDIPTDAGAMLLIEVDGNERLVEEESEKIRKIALEGNALNFDVAQGTEQAERLWEARRNVSPSLYKLRPHKISEDIVVPRTLMARLVHYLDELSTKTGLPVLAFGHAGDGNIHVNIMLDKEEPGELEKAQDIVALFFQRVIGLGGTITGEHGIGISKAPYLGMEISPPAIELMRRIKHAFDPKGILNPGKIFG